jgi:C1A family cysteine protease
MIDKNTQTHIIMIIEYDDEKKNNFKQKKNNPLLIGLY